MLDSIIDSMGMSLSKLWEIVKDREGWHAAVHGVAKSQDMTWQLSNFSWCKERLHPILLSVTHDPVHFWDCPIGCVLRKSKQICISKADNKKACVQRTAYSIIS